MNSSRAWLGIGVVGAAILIGLSLGRADTRVDRLAIRVDSLAVSLGQVVEAVEASRPAPQPDTVEVGTVGMSRGSDDAPITMVEFLDYECPFCQQFHAETLPTLIEEYVATGKLRFVLRDNPLGFHENALPAARAVRCAGEDGDEAFWRLSDALVAAGAPLDAERISAVANDVSLNAADLASCISSGRHDAAIEADASAAASAGLTGTPVFVVGPSSPYGSIRGRVIRGAYPIETFRTAIDEALASASQS